MRVRSVRLILFLILATAGVPLLRYAAAHTVMLEAGGNTLAAA